MGCRSFGVNTVLVGLHRVGLVGLKDILRKVGEPELEDRDEIIDRMIDLLKESNYVPDRDSEDFRNALWREYLRSRNKDFSEYLSRIEVNVRGREGDDRERFVEMLKSVFLDFELRPDIRFEPASVGGRQPQLLIDGEVITEGLQSRNRFKLAVRKSITDW